MDWCFKHWMKPIKFVLFVVLVACIVYCLCKQIYNLLMFELELEYYNTDSQQIDIKNIYVTIILSLTTAILTFIAFWIQYDFNKKLRIAQECERYQNQFDSLIQIDLNYKNNSHDLSFYHLFYEFKSIHYYIFKYFSDKNWPERVTSKDVLVIKRIGEYESGFKLPDDFIIYCSFTIFLCGLYEGKKADVGLNEKIIKNYQANTEKTIPEDVCKHILEGLSLIEDAIGQTHRKKRKKIAFLSDRIVKESNVPFQGHLRHLTPYFKTVFAILEFLSSYDDTKTKSTPELLATIDQCRKTFVAIMSIHEIALLYAYLGYFQIRTKPGVQKKYEYIFKEINDDNYYNFDYKKENFFDIEK